MPRHVTFVLFAMLMPALSLLRAEAAKATVPCRVALVFDDGPEPAQAEKLRDLLRRERVRITFAHVGRNVEKHPGLTRAAQDAGHEVINHSYSHTRIGELTAEQIHAEVTRAKEAITAALGRAPRWYWPPFLEVDDRLLDSLARAGQTRFVPHRLVDSRDWDRTTPAAEILRRATSDVRDGSVILFHEWRAETLEQLPAILSELRRQGCVFLTFSEMAAELKKSPPQDVSR